jgi:N-methylhydantoinase A/oxoprolinase/acetone carboxylase beta subunit
MVFLSTTLATNALIQGRASAGGLILIGHEPADRLPVEHFAVIRGGHDNKGKALAPLVLEEAPSAVA